MDRPLQRAALGLALALALVLAPSASWACCCAAGHGDTDRATTARHAAATAAAGHACCAKAANSAAPIVSDPGCGCVPGASFHLSALLPAEGRDAATKRPAVPGPALPVATAHAAACDVPHWTLPSKAPPPPDDPSRSPAAPRGPPASPTRA